jgi:hypothetical protein
MAGHHLPESTGLLSCTGAFSKTVPTLIAVKIHSDCRHSSFYWTKRGGFDLHARDSGTKVRRSQRKQ